MKSTSALITGGTGFIGGKLLDRLIQMGAKHLVLFVRPGTEPSRYRRFERAGVKIVQGVIYDPDALKRLFDAHSFDVVYHLAAIRGAGPLTRKEYVRTNVLATEQIARQAARTGSRLVFCSSVGVFGTIPKTLPAGEGTPYYGDTLYHQTKIRAEEHLRALIPHGLDVVIIRPTITYGIGDDGFPYALIKLVESGRFVHPSREVQIHLGDVQVLTGAFVQAAERELRSGSTYIVADRAPVRLRALVDLISLRLKDRPYPRWKTLPSVAFDLAAFVFGEIARKEAWSVRFQLIAKSWYYDTERTERDLQLEQANTLERFGYMIEWYLGTRRK